MTMFAAPRLLAAFLLVTVLGCSTTPQAGPDAPIAEVAEAATARTHAASVAAKPSCPFVRRVFRPGKETAYRFLADDVPLATFLDFVCSEHGLRPQSSLSEEESRGYRADISALRVQELIETDMLMQFLQFTLYVGADIKLTVDEKAGVALIDARRYSEIHVCYTHRPCGWVRFNPFERSRQAQGLKPLGPVNLD